MDCEAEDVDDAIRKDFENMPSHLFHDRYRDFLTKYVASLSGEKSNTAAAQVSSVRSFFSNETMSIRLPPGKVPKSEMAMHEHRFALEELQRMWLVADTEGKARLSVAVSLGWGVGDFKNLKTQFIRDILANVDKDGYVSFDYRRQKTRARIRGILNPCSVNSLHNYLKKVPKNQIFLWTARTANGLNHWLRTLFSEAGLVENGKLRFHLIRKYVFDIVSSQVGVYEAKLLTGKAIPLSDATYLHGLEDRLLKRYQKFAYPFFKLDGRESQEAKVPEEIQEKIEDLKTTVNVLSQARVIQELQIRRLLEEKIVESKRIEKLEKKVEAYQKTLHENTKNLREIEETVERLSS